MTKQLTLTFSTESEARLSRIMKLAEADSCAEVIANALQIYEWMIDQSNLGHDIALVQNGKIMANVKVFK